MRGSNGEIADAIGEKRRVKEHGYLVKALVVGWLLYLIIGNGQGITITHAAN